MMRHSPSVEIDEAAPTGKNPSMRSVLLDASPASSDACRQGADALRRALTDAGHEVRAHTLAELPISPCRGCFACWTSTPGRCPFQDASELLAREVINADLAVWYSPIRFGAWSWLAKKAMDRMICLISPHFDTMGLTRHKKRYARYPLFWGVGWLPGADSENEAVFNKLVEHNAYNMRSEAWEATVIHGDRPWALQREALLNAMLFLDKPGAAGA